jgi:hypothetical protein
MLSTKGRSASADAGVAQRGREAAEPVHRPEAARCKATGRLIAYASSPRVDTCSKSTVTLAYDQCA